MGWQNTHTLRDLDEKAAWGHGNRYYSPQKTKSRRFLGCPRLQLSTTAVRIIARQCLRHPCSQFPDFNKNWFPHWKRDFFFFSGQTPSVPLWRPRDSTVNWWSCSVCSVKGTAAAVPVHCTKRLDGVNSKFWESSVRACYYCLLW